jgi:hypothetical protein
MKRIKTRYQFIQSPDYGNFTLINLYNIGTVDGNEMDMIKHNIKEAFGDSVVFITIGFNQLHSFDHNECTIHIPYSVLNSKANKGHWLETEIAIN